MISAAACLRLIPTHFGLLLLLAVFAALPAVVSADQHEAKSQSKQPHPISVPNPGTQLWRDLRNAVPGVSQVRGTETGVLISQAGDEWRALRNETVRHYAGPALLGVLGVIAFFFLVRRRIKIDGGRSGKVVPRWTIVDRTLHWYVAVSFVLLAITGLMLLIGRLYLLPWMGPDVFGTVAGIGKQIHNWLGPFFTVGLLLLLAKWLKHNFPTMVDAIWLAKGGGIIGNAHPSADTLNGGEKIWYWIVGTVGLTACVTGLILVYPGFGQSREDMQLANIIHGIASVGWVCVFFGHAYIGTLGTEGALDGMTTGYVDSNWAKQHHDIWYERVKDEEVPAESIGSNNQSMHGGKTA